MTKPYDRSAVVAYARRWALSRNPAWFNFDGLGGDCTNFASQCVYAGAQVMNYRPVLGWYYLSLARRTPAWSGVEAFGQFLSNNRGAGPQTVQVDLQDVLPGDIIQLANAGDYYHSLVVTQTDGSGEPASVRICCHTMDSLDRPLSTYFYETRRCFHITGVGLP